jgi:methylated-DNA-[protein]-cysteine S-methyltransferase
METAFYSSPIGTLEITGDSMGIRSILYSETVTASEKFPESLSCCVVQLDEYFSGKRTRFDLKINPEGTEFQMKIWGQLLKIPFGETLSYLDLASITGDAKAVRAVGHANGQNKINIIIPCHRVIASNGKLTGYGGGLWRKEWLLKHEASACMPGLFSSLV